MKHQKYPASGQVYDVDNCLWDVRDARATKHGFDLLFGSPANAPLGSYCGGLPRLIATAALRDYWELHKTKWGGELYDLPAGRSTIKRVRRRLGLNLMEDSKDFFRKRIGDLKALSARAFAERHGVSIDIVMARRFTMLGRKARPLGWWQDEKALAVLRAPITLREAGERLGIKTSQVHRLRERVRGADPSERDGQLLKAA